MLADVLPGADPDPLVPSEGSLEPCEQVLGLGPGDDVDHTAWVRIHLLPGDALQGLRGEVISTRRIVRDANLRGIY